MLFRSVDAGPTAPASPPRKESEAHSTLPTSVSAGQVVPAVPSNDTSRVPLTLAPNLPAEPASRQPANRPDDERGALPNEPRSLPVLRDLVASCHACRLSETRTNTVFSRGNPQASIVFVGEAPGADEDAQGLPFVGRAGQLLDKMIAAMGLDPERDVYVCNIVKCRPPANRKPEPDELAACFPYLDEQLANVKPKVMVAMGTTAVLALFDTKMGITRVRGQWKLYKGRVPTMPTYHPSYLLRPSPQQVEAKRQCWEDLQAVMKELGLARKPKG